jgi:hypothetical protein
VSVEGGRPAAGDDRHLSIGSGDLKNGRTIKVQPAGPPYCVATGVPADVFPPTRLLQEAGGDALHVHSSDKKAEGTGNERLERQPCFAVLGEAHDEADV